MELTLSLGFSAPAWLILTILAMLGIGVPLGLRARRHTSGPGRESEPLALPRTDAALTAPATPERRLLDRAGS